MQFVILKHEMPESHLRSDHWDLMLEEDDDLRSWALSDTPALDREIPAVELAPHRKLYLDFQGPISNNRGHVRRVAAGHYEVIEINADRVRVFLEIKDTSLELPLELIHLTLKRSPKTKAPNSWTAQFHR